MDDDNNEVSTGILQIAQHEMIFRMNKDLTKAISFPFKWVTFIFIDNLSYNVPCWHCRALRKYGKKDDIFSFEMGRRCPSGSGFFCLRCSNANELYDELVARISQTCTNSLPRQVPAMVAEVNEQNREYINLTIQSNGRPNNEPIMMPVMPNRPGSSQTNRPRRSQPTYMNLEQYQYLVTKSKSKPNIYSTSPNATDDETSPTPRIQVSSQDHFAFNVQDSNTDLQHQPNDFEGYANLQHEYVNSNILNNIRSHSVEMDHTYNNVGRSRKSSEHEHTYQNHDFSAAVKAMRNLEDIKHKINASDDLGTFCMVNIDRNNPRIGMLCAFCWLKQIIMFTFVLLGVKNNLLPRSERTTPEPPRQSYIQLDLNNDKHNENNSEPNVENNAKKQNETLGSDIDGNAGPSTSGKTSNNENGVNKSNTAVPYAQIDFAKTLALSNSSANHRKLWQWLLVWLFAYKHSCLTTLSLIRNKIIQN